MGGTVCMEGTEYGVYRVCVEPCVLKVLSVGVQCIWRVQCEW
jgi:hypothetical protein